MQWKDSKEVKWNSTTTIECRRILRTPSCTTSTCAVSTTNPTITFLTRIQYSVSTHYTNEIPKNCQQIQIQKWIVWYLLRKLTKSTIDGVDELSIWSTSTITQTIQTTITFLTRIQYSIATVLNCRELSECVHFLWILFSLTNDERYWWMMCTTTRAVWKLIHSIRTVVTLVRTRKIETVGTIDITNTNIWIELTFIDVWKEKCE